MGGLHISHVKTFIPFFVRLTRPLMGVSFNGKTTGPLSCFFAVETSSCPRLSMVHESERGEIIGARLTSEGQESKPAVLENVSVQSLQRSLSKMNDR